MNTELYEKWIKSHRIEVCEVDVSDSVMNRIVQQTHKANILKDTWEVVLLDLVQARTLVRTSVLVSGAGIGLLRMFIQIYSVLFT